MGPSGRTRSKRNPKNNEPNLIPKGIAAAPSKPVRQIFIQPEPTQKKYKIQSKNNADGDYHPIVKHLINWHLKKSFARKKVPYLPPSWKR